MGCSYPRNEKAPLVSGADCNAEAVLCGMLPTGDKSFPARHTYTPGRR
jgi:hypothetical protein